MQRLAWKVTLAKRNRWGSGLVDSVQSDEEFDPPSDDEPELDPEPGSDEGFEDELPLLP